MATRKWSERVEKSKMFLLSVHFFPHHLFIFQTFNIKKKMLIEEGKSLQNLIKSFLPEVIQFAIQNREVSVVRYGCLP